MTRTAQIYFIERTSAPAWILQQVDKTLGYPNKWLMVIGGGKYPLNLGESKLIREMFIETGLVTLIDLQEGLIEQYDKGNHIRAGFSALAPLVLAQLEIELEASAVGCYLGLQSAPRSLAEVLAEVKRDISHPVIGVRIDAKFQQRGQDFENDVLSCSHCYGAGVHGFMSRDDVYAGGFNFQELGKITPYRHPEDTLGDLFHDEDFYHLDVNMALDDL